MDNEQKAEELIAEIEKMKKCYYKGFGNTICGIYFDAESYVKRPKRREKIKPHMLEMLEEIENFYDSIPFDELDSNSDFAPLFVTRELLPEYSRKVRELVDKPTENLADYIGKRRTTIWEIGEIYRSNFNRKIKELREIPGYENYEIRIEDYKGDEFAF